MTDRHGIAAALAKISSSPTQEDWEAFLRRQIEKQMEGHRHG